MKRLSLPNQPKIVRNSSLFVEEFVASSKG
uniref:Uncharacterized protein n=1 Tax=Medicago truncatula TaxID=3880 RepID=I3SWB8_MEDTR|nr:unknown [Medicago truncatula]